MDTSSITPLGEGTGRHVGARGEGAVAGAGKWERETWLGKVSNSKGMCSLSHWCRSVRSVATDVEAASYPCAASRLHKDPRASCRTPIAFLTSCTPLASTGHNPNTPFRPYPLPPGPRTHLEMVKLRVLCPDCAVWPVCVLSAALLSTLSPRLSPKSRPIFMARLS